MCMLAYGMYNLYNYSVANDFYLLKIKGGNFVKSRKVKKYLCVILSIIMVLGCLGGCNTKSKDTKETDGSSSTGIKNQVTDSAKSILNEVGTYPIVKEPIELKIFLMSMPNVEDFQTNDFTKYMEELTGIKLIFESGTRDDWEQKLNLELQTGTYPDIIMSVGVDQAKYGVKEGILIQLDDLIAENMPNYMKNMGQYIDATKQTDGHIYSIAGLNDCYHCQYGRKMWVNTHYLEEMGVDIPTTTEEFIEVCKKFLEYKPDGIAIAGANTGWYTKFDEWLMNSFTLDPGRQQTYRDKTVVSPEGKVFTIANTDKYRAGLIYMNELYEIGAIYDGNFTQTSEQLRAIMNQEDEPVLFVPFGTISDGVDADSNNETYRHYQAMAPLKGPDGTQFATFFKYSGLQENSFSITDKCKYPEVALRWCDWFFAEFADLYSQFGADEGTDWVLNPSGKMGITGENALYEVLNLYSSESQNHDWQDVSIRYAPATYRLGAATDNNVDVGTSAGLEKLLYDASKNCYEPYAQGEGDLDILPTLKLTAEEATEIQTIGVEVEKYIEESKVAFITGAKDLDKDWDSFVKGLDNVGLQTLLKVYQTAYDRQK
jgi:putative aldouronate transport system substrate-binding protein